MSELERTAKCVARQLNSGAEVSSEAKALNERKEKAMGSVISAMVAREKNAAPPEAVPAFKSYNLVATEDPTFVAWHKMRVMWIRRLKKWLKKRRMNKAVRYLVYILELYKEESKQLGLEDAVVEKL